MNRKIYISCLCLVLVIIMLFMVINFQPKTIKVNALSYESSACGAVVIEQNSKRVLYEKNKDKKLPMASTTKIMTALVALENCKDLDEIHNIDNRASGIEGTSIYLQKNEKLCMKDLLFGLMLASGNDAACAIAYIVGNGSMETFVDKMNEKAENLGLVNTHFDNPHGLDSETHHTSAYDLAIITAEAMKNETFKEIVNTKVKQIAGNDKVESRFVRNKHQLVGKMKGCNGVKTGFTDNARRCCVTSVNRDNMTLICVVLNCQDMFNDSENLLEDAFNSYKLECVLKPYYLLDEQPTVVNGVKPSVKVASLGAYFYPLKEDEIKGISIKTNLQEKLTAPVEKEKNVGTIEVYLNNDLIFSENVYTIENVEEKNIIDYAKDIVENWYYGEN